MITSRFLQLGSFPWMCPFHDESDRTSIHFFSRESDGESGIWYPERDCHLQGLYRASRPDPRKVTVEALILRGVRKYEYEDNQDSVYWSE